MSSSVVTEPKPGIEDRDAPIAPPIYDEFFGTKIRTEATRGGDGPTVSRERTAGDGFALETFAVRGDVEIHGDGPSRVIALWVQHGEVETCVRDATATARRGEVLIVATGTAPFRLRIRDAESRLVAIDRSLLDRVAGDVVLPAGAARPSPYVGSLVARGPGAVELWIRTHAYVAETMGAGDADSPLVAANLGRLLALTTLTVFGVPGRRPAAVVRSTGSGDASYPAMLRKAMAYIEAHARYDVSVNDVAAAVYLTPRALQYMFRKHLDVTPMAYLRRIRLEHVHAELVRSTRRTTTVSTAAARWGFAHTGRFAVLYRETYGRSPHVTLRE